MKLMNFMKFIKFHPYLIFLERETTEHKRFLPKILDTCKVWFLEIASFLFYGGSKSSNLK